MCQVSLIAKFRTRTWKFIMFSRWKHIEDCIGTVNFEAIHLIFAKSRIWKVVRFRQPSFWFIASFWPSFTRPFRHDLARVAIYSYHISLQQPVFSGHPKLYHSARFIQERLLLLPNFSSNRENVLHEIECRLKNPTPPEKFSKTAGGLDSRAAADGNLGGHARAMR